MDNGNEEASLDEIAAELGGLTRGGAQKAVSRALQQFYRKSSPQFREEIVKHFSDPAMLPEELKPKQD